MQASNPDSHTCTQEPVTRDESGLPKKGGIIIDVNLDFRVRCIVVLHREAAIKKLIEAYFKASNPSFGTIVITRRDRHPTWLVAGELVDPTVPGVRILRSGWGDRVRDIQKTS